MPANVGSAMMSSIWSRNGHNVVSSGAVTVTPVNVEDIPIGNATSTTRNTEIIKGEFFTAVDLAAHFTLYLSFFSVCCLFQFL